MVCPPDHLSPSAWSDWESCPRKWAEKRIYRRPDPVGWQAEVGTFAHWVLETIMSQGHPDQRTVEAARRFARMAWDEGHILVESIARGEITEAAFKRRAWLAIEGLWELEDPTQVDVVATEQQFDWVEGDVPMRCIVDRVDRLGPDSLTPGLLAVIDYKTGKVPPAKKDYRDKAKRQITVGAMAVASQDAPMGPLAVAEGGALLYLSADTVVDAPTGKEARRAVSEQARQVWGEIVAACETEDFPARAGPLCSWCPFVVDCDEGFSRVRTAIARGWVTGDEPGAKLVAAAELDVA